MNHVMDRTPRIVTIIGLVFEGLSVIMMGFIAFVFKAYLTVNNQFFVDLLTEDGASTADIDFVFKLYEIIGNVLIVLAVVIGLFFILNIVLFTKLIKGRYSEETAKKVYLYQAIYGGVNLLFNTLVGILYLISGVMGRQGRKDEINVREGI